jgi:2-dehydro-3-deoxyphosphogluconate aldolase / (4S)-4-hydroxy-2-oxoglutarate aldolase
MNKNEILGQIRQTGIVPVIRAENEVTARELIHFIYQAGIKVFEVTLTVSNAPELIEKLRTEYQDKAVIGAGTVLNPAQAKECLNAGAQFIVSPLLNIETVDFCRQNNVAVMPGALTPTEIHTAWQAGADVVKVFPANAAGGAKYLKSIKTVFTEIKLMPTGGVNLENIADFFRAGAFAVGAGGELANAKLLKEGRGAEIAALARNFLESISKSSDQTD